MTSGAGRAAGALALLLWALSILSCVPPGTQPAAQHAAIGPANVPFQAEARPSATGSAATPAAGYVGSEACVNCHRPQYARFAASNKGRLLLQRPRNDVERLGCEACHGPGEAHVEAENKNDVPGFLSFAHDDPAPVAERNAVCLRCHEGTNRMSWAGSQHETRELACTNCHSLMSEVSEQNHLKQATVLETCGQCHRQQLRSQQLSVSRMPVLEQKMQCTSCHNPHGSPNEKLLLEPSVNETCYSCHAEKRGPFLWEHAPVAENCANCHEPHGSRNEKLLSVPKPRLCQQCHVESRHPTTPFTSTSTNYVLGRQCVNCHSMVHGSNHPGGARFQR